MKNNIIVSKIILYIEKIQRYTCGMNYDNFIKNEIIVEACVFNLSQIGELANKIADDFKTNNMEIPWKQMYGLRNRIVHDYEGVNLILVWEIISYDLPELKQKLERLIKL